MSGEADSRLARMKRLPPRLRIAHLVALLRHETDGSLRAAELTRLLAAQSALADGHRG
ncbi:hypothetical protein [Bradyrhizobium erythrophlei]|jgi:hypothetical protein|uniref:Uncharacterized protein n=1 Tax=Bradyrhizobium erythrophlei TaxID=1437360 RepID=A0A1M7UF77_9BRAD|nr:hypothetical protein [Bradyrhizobium erythrophlei]SHN81628.1 hypothetical protein SAMN05444170_4807 [Bradyrhizobium erythrophlei]